ncbi:MAG: radical SAM protein [Bacillota bacterium]
MIPDSATLQKLLVEAVRDHNVLPLTGRCNLSCCFCSHGQNPPGTQAYDFPAVEEWRLLELAAYLDPAKKIVIGESATRLREGEPLTHPQFTAILKQLRKNFPETPLQLTTNGSLLTKPVIELLASLAPLELIVSLNSAGVRGRRLLMNDPQPLQAARALDQLNAAGIPLHGSVVALPHLAGWDDLEQTLLFLNNAGAQTIRLLLPGFTRLSNPALLPPPDFLARCRCLAGELRAVLNAPLLLEPAPIDHLEPVIEGALPGSPAAAAGLCAGDLIMSVDQVKPATRVEAFNAARRKRNPTVRFLRGGSRLEALLPKQRGESPGFIVSYDLDPDQVERVRRYLSPGRESLMLTSPAALERWQWARDQFNLAGLCLLAVPSKFFGGSINCAGLLTVIDFLSVLEHEKDAVFNQQVLIPAAAFDRGGRDMQGRHYSILQQTGALITLVE